MIVDENDVLRDEGEAYARRLTEAGVRTTSVRYNGTIHDFLMLNPLRATAATTAAVEQAIHVLRKALGTPERPPATRGERTMSEQTPTVVLVHGAFAESASWNAVIERLHERGAGHRGRTAVVAAANPLRSVTGDAAYVRDVIAGIGGPVVLVGHSYGGIVITEAAAGNDAVVGLVYVGRFAPEQGESALQLSTMFPGSTLGDALAAYPVTTGGNELMIRQELFHHQFAAESRPNRRRSWRRPSAR